MFGLPDEAKPLVQKLLLRRRVPCNLQMTQWGVVLSKQAGPGAGTVPIDNIDHIGMSNFKNSEPDWKRGC